MDIKKLVKQLDLKPHPEGGFYKETYRSTDNIEKSVLPPTFKKDFSICTGIYFLLTENNFSAFHRIPQDEMWHFYAGAPLQVHVIHPTEAYEIITVGNPLDGYQPQAVVPGNCWFGSNVKPGGQYSLVGCTVAPGFEFDHFELAERTALLTQYPQHKDIILNLTRA